MVSAEDCKRLVRHSPSSDAEYKPGVDVRGKAVAPADLPGTNTLKLPESFEFDITLQVFERLGIAVPQGLNETQLTVGKVSVGKNGVITFNGEPVDGSEEAAIAAACQEMLQQLRR